jgi:putative glutamine amidotransferase
VQPIIGIPTSVSDRRARSEFAVRQAYCAAVHAAGGVPLLVPPLPEGALRAAYAALDGLLLPGGGDVGAHHYGGVDSRLVQGVNAARDDLEIALARWALADGLPLLAICRGIQVLNVAAGGSLIQDIPTQVETMLTHAPPARVPAEHLAHTVTLAPGSRLAAIYSPEREVWVNSRHHQAVERVAPGLRVVARAADGVIEGLEPETADGRFLLGVQWHPEDLAPGDAATRRLFAAHVEAARERAASRRPGAPA